MISRVKALAPVVQNAGAALLIDGHADLVARAGADGAHLTGIAALEEVMPSLKPDRIAGVGRPTRHNSMAAGELGADYVLFGEPDAQGQRPSVEAIAERLQWWDELFEPPCVGYAASREEAAAFAAAGADFCWSAISSGPIRANRRRDASRSTRRSSRRTPKHSGKPGLNKDDVGMKLLRPIAIALGGLMATGASAQISLTPAVSAAQSPPAKLPAKKKEAPKAAPKETSKESSKPKAPAVARKPATPKPAASPTPAPTPTPTFDDPNVDLVYGAYQRGLYKTAFDPCHDARDLCARPQVDDDAGRALRQCGSASSATMPKAAEWYQRAADAGDREGMFALAMMRLSGRGGSSNREEAVKLLASSAKLGNPKAAYNLALLYSRRPDAAAGDFEALRRIAPHRRRRRQPRGAICAGDVLQGRHRRAEGHREGGEAAAARASRASQCPRDRIRHRAL